MINQLIKSCKLATTINVRVNKMISLYLLLWFLLLKSGSTEGDTSFDDDLCAIRFYSIQYFKGNAWTLVSGGEWEYSKDTHYSHPIGKFVPKSIRTYGDKSKCKQVWRICPFGAVQNNRMTKCRKLRHGQALPSVSSRWGWNDKFLGLVRILKKAERTRTTSERIPHPSLPLTVPKETSFNRNLNNTDTTTFAPQNSIPIDRHKEENRSHPPSTFKTGKMCFPLFLPCLKIHHLFIVLLL